MTIAVDLGRKANKQTNKQTDLNYSFRSRKSVKGSIITTLLPHLKYKVNHLPARHDICRLLSHLLTMAVGPGFKLFAAMIKSSLKCILIYSADVKADDTIRTKYTLAGLGLEIQKVSASAI